MLFASLVASPLIAFCANNDPRIVKTVESHWREHADVRGWSDTRVEVSVVSAPEKEPKCDKPPEVVVVEPKEAHGFRDLQNNVNLYTKMLAFFDKYIGPGAKTAAAGSP